MTDIIMELLDYIRSLRVISSHNHHLPDEQFAGMDLKRVLENSYTNWMAPPPDFNDSAAVSEYINKYRCNSFFRWLFEALEQLYGIPFTPQTVLELDDAVKAAYLYNQNIHLDILREHCRFERVVNERQPDPGSNLGHSGLFAPSFRCDCFFSGWLKDKPEPNGFYAYSLFEEKNIETIPDYLEQMRLAILNKKKSGCMALKAAIAYERPLTFENTDMEKAAKAFNNPDASESDILAFGDTVMFAIARAAAEFELPLQIHTGMGQCRATNPIGLIKLIDSNPKTRFHLLHGGFPWFADTYALLLQYKNVWSDTCWIPYLSTTAAAEYIVKCLEVSDAYRLTWGCDTWISEDSCGALLAMEHALSRALESMINDGAIDMEYAKFLAKRILHDNAAELFKL